MQRPLIVCLRNGVQEVCQATRQSLFQRVEKAAAEEDTFTAPFHFLVDSASSFRQLFVNEVWMCSTSSATTWTPSGNDRPSSFKQLKIEMPCWTKGHVLQFVFFVAAGAALSDVIVTFTNQETLEVQRKSRGPCAGESRCCSDSLQRTVGS